MSAPLDLSRVAIVFNLADEARRRGRPIGPRPVALPPRALDAVSARELEDALAWVERSECSHAPRRWCRHRRVLRAVEADLAGVAELGARVRVAVRLELAWARVGRMYPTCPEALERAAVRVLERAGRHRAELRALELEAVRGRGV